MQIVNYQFAAPSQIYKVEQSVFQLLMKERIYQINPSFQKNSQCMKRLIEFIKQRNCTKEDLKIIREMIKYFQLLIFYFIGDFYFKNRAFLKQLKGQSLELSQKSKKQMLDILQDIGGIYVKLSEGQQQIEEFQFFTRYGISSRKLKINKTQEQYQNKYWRFLKKCLITKKILQNSIPVVQSKARKYAIQRILEEFHELVKDRESFVLEKMTVDKILLECDLDDQQVEIPKTLSKDNILRQYQYQENQHQTFYQSSSLPMQAQIESLKKISPCCRTFFFSRQMLHHAQSATLQYKNFKFPYDKYCVTNLRRAICAFLNRAGGVILVGVSQRNQDKYREIKGQILSEYKKEELLKQFKKICQEIQPDIVSQNKYAIKFVPIKEKNGKYIAGKYIVRVQVVKGDQKSLYTIKQYTNNQGLKEFVAFRLTNQVLKRQITQQTLAKFKQRLLNPPKHESLPRYPQPEIGIPLLDQRNVAYEREDKEEQKNGNKKKERWMQKQQPCSPPTLQNDTKDCVYLRGSKFQDQNLFPRENKKHRFICDEDDQNENQIKRNVRKQNIQKQQKQIESENEELDFQPQNKRIHPKYYTSSSKNSKKIQEIEKVGLKQSSNKLEYYKVHRHMENTTSQCKVPSIDLLIVGFPYSQVKPLIKDVNIELIEDPIQCSDDCVTWIKVRSNYLDVQKKVKEFMLAVKRKKELIQSRGVLKIRKLFSNVCFQDQVLLNKLIHKFRHNQQFCDQKGVYYFACKNNLQAIAAYKIGWELNIKIKFISNEQMKLKKLVYLKEKLDKK